MIAGSEKIPYNAKVLRWARERRRLDRSEAARRAAVPPEKIEEWEDGRSEPTVRQARLLASAYDRPFLEFFSASIPDLKPPQLAPDFRSQKIAPGSLELTALENVQEWAEGMRLNAIDLYEMLGEPTAHFPTELRASVNDDPEKAAQLTRSYLKFSVERQTSLKASERGRFPTILRGIIESSGVLVLKQSGLSKTRTRGICLYDDVLPIIVFGNEAPGGQAFTLAHEFGHVILGETAISGSPILAYRHGSICRKVEGWCNAFAAAFLIPSDALISHPLAPRSFVDSISDSDLGALANSFAVSRHAMLIRLVTLKLVDPRFYWRRKRPEFLLEEANFSGEGRSKYYGSRYRGALGDLYTGLVIEALGTGRLGYHSASEFMGIKNVRHLQDIQSNFGT